MLSKKQKRVLDYIGKFLKEREYSPSYLEIGEGVGVSSKSTVFKYIKILKEKGFISDISGKKRSLFLTGFAGKIFPVTAQNGNEVRHSSYESEVSGGGLIPLYGYIEAGYPVEAVQVEESISIPEDFHARNKRDLFALKVKGDSMTDDMIKDGDTIILKKTAEVPNGKIVAAIVDGYEATLKRYYKTGGGKVKLVPSNPLFKPIILDAARVRIIGELAGLLRKY